MSKLVFAACAAGLVGTLVTPVSSSNAATTAPVTGRFVQKWVATTTAHIGQSAPTAATVGRVPAIVVGTRTGTLSAFRLSDGAALWREKATGGSSINSALSTDGVKLYTTLTGSSGMPGMAAFDLATGKRVWTGWICTQTPCEHLSGPTVGGNQLYMGGPGQYVRTFASSSGAGVWSYHNTDTTNSTPAFANLTGSGPVVIHTNDQTPNNLVQPPAQSGGHLRIFNASKGMQYCNANIGGGPITPGSFNSSAAVGSVGGAPIIAFGTGASGALPNQVLAYNSSCQRLWLSTKLGGPTVGAPIFADVNGNGVPRIIQQVATSDRRTAIYVLDARTGAVIRKTSPTDAVTGAQCTNYAQGSAASVVTLQTGAAVRQDLVVSAGSCGVLVLDGRTLARTAQLGRSCAVQNTPVVTRDPDGSVAVTMAGYRAKAGGASEGCVFHYSLAGAQVGSWPQFHHDGQLSGASARSFPAVDTLFTGQQLASGKALYTPSRGYSARMQTNGQLAIYAGTRLVRTFGPASGGARLVVSGGVAKILSTKGVTTWSTPSAGSGKAPHFYLSKDGQLRLAIADGNAWTADRMVWHS